MTSPRRSNRGGHTRGSRKKDGIDNGGDRTRCVCNQQHHEGVMIQCETCKVWQHCPCVGLGNGELTPDKYFCESCRPQNHPYSVIHGALISNSKKVPHQSPSTAPATRVSLAPSSMSYSSKSNPPKKRNTMNSKEASIPMDLMLAQQKWNDEHMDEILDDDITSRLSNKKRKKNESATDVEDDGYSSDHAKGNDTVTFPKIDVKSEFDFDTNKKMEQLPSPEAAGGEEGGQTWPLKNKRMLSSKSRPSSPITNIVEVEVCTNPLKGKERPAVMAGRPSTDSSRQESAVAIKKRKTGKTISAEDEGLPVKPEPHTSQAFSSSESSANYSAPSNIAFKDPREEVFEKSISSVHRHGSRIESPAPKKSLLRRGAERNSQRQSSRHSTPAPNSNTSDDAQSIEPVGPALVRYPSAKMTIHEMSKRAKQLLDYISRIQIDMADRKNKGCPFPTEQLAKISAGPALLPTITPATTATAIAALPNPTEKIPEAQRFSASAVTKSAVQPGLQEVHVYHDHQDDGRVPDLSRTSMDSIGPVMESNLAHENHPHHSNVNDSGPMSIKVIPVTTLDISPLLSTPPLSVHDHPMGHYRLEQGYRPTVNTTRVTGSRNHAPLTPPHQLLEPFITEILPSDGPEVLAARSLNSLEIMDKLTGDLIRFQEKYGSLH